MEGTGLPELDFINTAHLPRSVHGAQVIKPQYRLSTRIKAGKIIDQLQRCVEGKVELSPSQVNAARILLNKVIPDLKSLEVQQSPATARNIRDIPTHELLTIIDGHAKRLLPTQSNTAA
jgi:hypothetical protein